MQVYAGHFFKEPSPDSEPSVDDSYCGFGVSELSDEFHKPVPKAHDYWDIPPVKCVSMPSLL